MFCIGFLGCRGGKDTLLLLVYATCVLTLNKYLFNCFSKEIMKYCSEHGNTEGKWKKPPLFERLKVWDNKYP